MSDIRLTSNLDDMKKLYNQSCTTNGSYDSSKAQVVPGGAMGSMTCEAAKIIKMQHSQLMKTPSTSTNLGGDPPYPEFD